MAKITKTGKKCRTKKSNFVKNNKFVKKHGSKYF